MFQFGGDPWAAISASTIPMNLPDFLKQIGAVSILFELPYPTVKDIGMNAEVNCDLCNTAITPGCKPDRLDL